MHYRREIDGLRAVAVIPVILFHAGFSIFSGGFVGVDVFFVISGYLITTILLKELADGEFSILRFYERRARRILPALFVVMLACIPFAWAWMLPWQFDEFAQSLVAVTLFVSNVLFWSQTGYFQAEAEEKPLLHTWSLAVEEQYYLLFPPALFLLWRFGRRPAFYAILAMTLVSLLLSEWGSRGKSVATFFLAPTRAWEILAGSICAFAQLGAGQRRSGTLSLGGLAMILFAIFAFDEHTRFPSFYALVPVLGAALIILFAAPGTWAARLLSWAPLAGVGLISYSAYLWHQPLFAFARIRSLQPPEQALMTALAALSLGLGYLNWRFVERPFRNKSAAPLVTRRAVFTASGVIGAAFIAFGAAGHLGHGLSFRLPGDMATRLTEIETLHIERDIEIRVGTCHFGGRGQYSRIDGFLENWDCGTSPAPDGGTPRIALYGDSHAADKANALRAAGARVAQMSANGCPLIPEKVAFAYCAPMLRQFHAAMRERGIRTVFLGNRLDPHELEAPYLQAVFSYWAERYDQVILFSPMPEFPKFETAYARHGADTGAHVSRDNTADAAFFSALAGITLPENLTVLNTRQLFCAGRDGCDPIQNGATLLVDYGHLSPVGARHLGDQLVPALGAALGQGPTVLATQ
jgi:peptidoglycan/LPS O-acetylase OafA/YrhL